MISSREDFVVKPVHIIYGDTLAETRCDYAPPAAPASLEQNTIRSTETHTRTHIHTQGWYSGDGLNRLEGVLGHCRDMPVDILPLKTSCWLCCASVVFSSLYPGPVVRLARCFQIFIKRKWKEFFSAQGSSGLDLELKGNAVALDIHTSASPLFTGRVVDRVSKAEEDIHSWAWVEHTGHRGGNVAECSETRETKQRIQMGSISNVSLWLTGDYLIIQLSLFFCSDECWQMLSSVMGLILH